MREYISTKFNVIHKDLKEYEQMSESEAKECSNKENFKCFQFKHQYGDQDKEKTCTQIRMVSFKNGITYGPWSNS